MSVPKPGDLVFTGEAVKGWDVAAGQGVDVATNLPALVVSVDPPNMLVLLDDRKIVVNIYSVDLVVKKGGAR